MLININKFNKLIRFLEYINLVMVIQKITKVINLVLANKQLLSYHFRFELIVLSYC